MIKVSVLKRFTLCADDFGLNDSVNRGILDLASSGRLNAISCMAVGSAFSSGAMKLKELVKKHKDLQIGLHLTLTEYTPLTQMNTFAPNTFPTIGKLLIQTHLRKISIPEVTRELTAQVDRFEEILGFAPHFIDGHQHAHILPGIREEVIELAKSRMNENGWIRSCYQPLPSILKARISVMRTLLISSLSKELARLAQENCVSTNAAFYGINDFSPQTPFPELMRKWLDTARHQKGNLVFMCHPGRSTNADASIPDPIRIRRPQEFAYFASDEFMNDLRETGFDH